MKLSDFGLTRAFHGTDYYRFKDSGMLPVKWMAPESLTAGIFTSASDIWSFGILLYEIITFGKSPYHEISNDDMTEYLKSGNTLVIPESVKPEL